MSTNEAATAALKGMLGIGGGIAAAPSTPAKQVGAVLATDNSSHSNKKSGKNKRDNSAKKTTQKYSNSYSGKGSATKNPSSNKKNQPEGKPPVSENFAWSAFQASPDASALPLPEFVSPSTPPKGSILDAVDPDKLSILLSAVRTSDDAAPIEIVNAPRAEDIEAEAVAEAQKHAAAAKRVEMDDALKVPEQKPDDEPVCSGGINLAALVTSPPATNKQSTEALSPGNSLVPPTPPQFSPPFQQQQYAHPQHQQLYMQPGYMTIQVQVPHNLMPDRLMIVHTPSGYPVQVRVPEGVPPGMVIPVLVPAAPAHLMPQHYPQQYGMQNPFNNSMPPPRG